MDDGSSAVKPYTPWDSYPDDGAHFKRDRLSPAPIAYVGVDDLIVLRFWSPIVASTVNLSLRYQATTGKIIREFYSVTATTVGTTPNIKIIPGAEGYLLSATIECPGTTRGQCFVELTLQFGQGSGDNTFGQTLIGGYPGASYKLGYPQSSLISPTDGRGAMRSINVTTPGAGADFTQTVPTGVNWILRSVFAAFVASASVATRVLVLEIDNAVPQVVLFSPVTQNITASQAANISWFNGALTGLTIFAVTGGIPSELRIPAGWVIRSNTQNLQATDQWSTVRLIVEEYIAA